MSANFINFFLLDTNAEVFHGDNKILIFSKCPNEYIFGFTGIFYCIIYQIGNRLCYSCSIHLN